MKPSRPTLIIAIACVSLMLLVILFPPWTDTRLLSGTVRHGFLFAPPRLHDVRESDGLQHDNWFAEPYMPLLILEVSGILCAGILAWIIVTLVASRKRHNP